MNLIQANGYRGIDLFSGCDNNTVDVNYVAYNNRTGIYLGSSSNNTIYHNDFINNRQQAATFLSQNNFDDGYPVGGNYWSDNNGTDSNNDGISDTPYIVGANNTDNFPMMKTLQTTAKGDVNLDGIVDIYDAITLAKAYDSSPGQPNWNPYADFNKDNKVDIFDALILAANFGKKIT
jgi:parallel beta-helix repeat protein